MDPPINGAKSMGVFNAVRKYVLQDEQEAALEASGEGDTAAKADGVVVVGDGSTRTFAVVPRALHKERRKKFGGLTRLHSILIGASPVSRGCSPARSVGFLATSAHSSDVCAPSAAVEELQRRPGDGVPLLRGVYWWWLIACVSVCET